MADAKPRTILITGSSGEIGSHLAGHFLAAGWNVLGLDREAPATTTSLVFRRCDLADGAQTLAAIDGLAESHGACDAVVNCAGRIANAPLVRLGAAGFEIHDFALWSDVIASSLTAAFHVTAVAARHMLEARRKGVVVNISSVCARGNPGQVAYSAAKAGLDGMTRALAKELGPMGIRVVGLAPGYFDTRSTRDNVPQAKLAKVTGAVPLRRLGTLEELSYALDFIIGNAYLNGTILELDGGLVL